MSMFDTYRPAGKRECPVCGAKLETWQGKDGPCALFIWVEGCRNPVGQEIDDEDVKWPENDLGRFSLPGTFVIYSYDCPSHQPIEAECLTDGGIWSRTTILGLDSTD
jgi:hypothetical protein